MPTMPTCEPLMISEPDQAPAAVENLKALELVTPHQARVLAMLAQRGEPMRVERTPYQRRLHVLIGDSERLYVMRTGRVRYLETWA
jgi:hypothetical protein